MSGLLFFISLIILFVLQFVLRYKLQRVLNILAEYNKGITRSGSTQLPIMIEHAYKRDIDGEKVLFRKFLVKGNSLLQQFGIRTNDIINIRCLKKDEINTKLKSGDVVAIFQNDDEFRGYKLRILKDIYEDDETISTSIDSFGAEVIEKYKWKEIVGIFGHSGSLVE